jgi:ATP-dependent protease HslVU (ClpYQ) peptidase subunit
MRRSASGVRIISRAVNLLPPEHNREVMDDDELIAAIVSGGDTALWAALRAGAGTSPA